VAVLAIQWQGPTAPIGRRRTNECDRHLHLMRQRLPR
jgi:hypothetical protein